MANETIPRAEADAMVAAAYEALQLLKRPPNSPCEN